MRYLKKPGKMDLLLNLFYEVGIKYKESEVLEIAGIKSGNALRVACTYLRKSKHVPDENRIDIRIGDGYCTRVN